MYKITWSKSTKKHSWSSNTKEYIVLHHTWHWNTRATTENVTDYLAFNPAQVSCHYVVWTEEDKKIYKLADHKYVTWHAWFSSWEGKTWMNKYSIGIEIMSHDGKTYDDWQRWAVKWLVQNIMKEEKISHENVIRHLDISPWRKWDVSDELWNNKFNTYKEYQDSLKIEHSFTDKEKAYFAKWVKYEDILMRIRSRMWDDIPNDEFRELLHDANKSTRPLSEFLTKNSR